MTLESAANNVQFLRLKQLMPLAKFAKIAPVLLQNPFFSCWRDGSLKHITELVTLVHSYLTKSAANLTELRSRKH